MDHFLLPFPQLLDTDVLDAFLEENANAQANAASGSGAIGTPSGYLASATMPPGPDLGHEEGDDEDEDISGTSGDSENEEDFGARGHRQQNQHQQSQSTFHGGISAASQPCQFQAATSPAPASSEAINRMDLHNRKWSGVGGSGAVSGRAGYNTGFILQQQQPQNHITCRSNSSGGLRRAMSKKNKSKMAAMAMMHQQQPQLQHQQRHNSMQQSQVPPPQATAEIDPIYMNASTSNVSPDSGIQSEGVASSSPLHLGDTGCNSAVSQIDQPHTQPTQQVSIHGQQPSTQPPLPQQQHQNFHPAFSGPCGPVATSTSSGTQVQQQHSICWNSIGQHQGYPQQHLIAQQPHPFPPHPIAPLPNNSNPFGNLSQKQLQSPQEQQPQRLSPVASGTTGGSLAQVSPIRAVALNCNAPSRGRGTGGDTPPPILEPSVPIQSHSLVERQQHQRLRFQHPEQQPSLFTEKRSRGRPKGSRNKASSKPKKVTMECGSQTDMTSIADCQYSTDSDGSDGGGCIAGGAGGDTSRPPKPILMVPSSVRHEERKRSSAKSGRGRPPRKDGPPTLEMQQKPATLSSSYSASKNKNCDTAAVMDGIRVKTRVSPPISADSQRHEVIILDSDDGINKDVEDVVADEEPHFIDQAMPPSRGGQARRRRRRRRRLSSTSGNCSSSEDGCNGGVGYGGGVYDDDDECVEILRSSSPRQTSRMGRGRPSPSKSIVAPADKKNSRERNRTQREPSKKKKWDSYSKSEKIRSRTTAPSPPPLQRGPGAKSSNHQTEVARKISKKKKRRRRKRDDTPTVRPPSKSRKSLTPITTSDRESSRSPSRTTSPPPGSRRMSRQENFVQSSLQQRPSSRSSSTFSFTSGEVVAVFDKRFSTRTSDHFWTPSPSPVRSSANADVDASAHVRAQRQRRRSRPSSSTESCAIAVRTAAAVQTKGSLKEMPPSSFFHQSSFVGSNAGGGASTKTMLSVLAETNRKGKPGRKRRRGRRSCSNEEWSDKPEERRKSSKNKQQQQQQLLQQHHHQPGISPASSCHSSKSPFSPRSNPCSEGSNFSGHRYSDILDCSEGYKKSTSKKKEKRNMQRWKSKHNNVTDPVLLGHVENLIQDMSTCQLERAISRDYWPTRPHDSVPSIFKKRRILSSRQREEKTVGVAETAKRSKRRPFLLSVDATEHAEEEGPELASSLLKACEEAEQRLPLKKRHHHHQLDSATASSECVILPTIANPRSEGPSSLDDASPGKTDVVRAADDVHIVFESGKKQPSRRNSRNSSTDAAKGHKGKRNQHRSDGSNIKGSIATRVVIVDKHTVEEAAVAKSLMTPLTIDTNDPPTTPKSTAASKAVTPRKRHLMEMMQDSAAPSEEPAPPMLDKAPSPTLPLLITKTTAAGVPEDMSGITESSHSDPSPPTVVPCLATEIAQSSVSPPRLSPQGCHEHEDTSYVAGRSVAEPRPLLPSQASIDQGAGFASGGGSGTWSAVQRSKKVLSAKYSDISDDSSSSVSSLKLRLRRERTPPQDMEAAFARLRESITEKEKKKEVAPEDSNDGFSLPYISSDDDPLAASDSAAANSAELSFVVTVKEKSRQSGVSTENKKGRNQVITTAEAGEEKSEDELPRQRTRRPSQKQREANESSLNEKQPLKVVKPHILKGRKRKCTEGKGVTLQKCSVRVHKLTDLEILESSPSPTSLNSASPRSNPPDDLALTNLVRSDLTTASPVAPLETLGQDGSALTQKLDGMEEESLDLGQGSCPAQKKRKRRSNKTGFPSNKRKKRTKSADGPSGTANNAPRPKPRKPKSGSYSRMCGDASKAPVRVSSRIIAIDGEKKGVAEERAEEPEPPRQPDTPRASANIHCHHQDNVDGDDIGVVGTDILSQAISQIVQEQQHQEKQLKGIGEKRRKSGDSEMKRPRGRPPKKKHKKNGCAEPLVASSSDDSLSRDDASQLRHSASAATVTAAELVGWRRPRIVSKSCYEEGADDEMDCLSLLPPLSSNCESGLSSETPSGAEAEDNSRSSSSNRKKKTKSSSSSMFKKKTSLKAGLFADSYKDGEERRGKETAALGGGGVGCNGDKKSISYHPVDHPNGLLPPPYYCGRKLRERKADFQLPYDLWWMHANKQLPGRDVAATWNYKKISKNYYFDVKPLPDYEANQSCQCVSPRDPAVRAGCGEECINRMTYAECDPKLCPVGDHCSNNAIQKHRGVTSSLERFMTEKKGWGIKTKVSVVAGQFITEYVGEIVSDKVFKHRMMTDYVGDTHHYCLHLDGGTVIDGHRMGGECRFVNHSCEPNCEIQKWTVGGHYRMALFSLKDISPGEELTYDYNFSLFNPHEGQSCQCGSAKCRGVIGGRTQRLSNGTVDADGAGGSSAIGNGSSDCSNSGGGGGGHNGGSAGEKWEGGSKKRSRVPRVKRSECGIPTANRLNLLAPMKQMSQQQQNYVRLHRCFLLRNLEKVRRVRESVQRKVSGQMAASRKEEEALSARRPADMILTGLTALATARSMQTRRLTIAQDDPSVTKVVKLAQLLREIFAQITTVDGKCSSSIVSLKMCSGEMRAPAA